jgi:hypothetical protein
MLKAMLNKFPLSGEAFRVVVREWFQLDGLEEDLQELRNSGASDELIGRIRQAIQAG